MELTPKAVTAVEFTSRRRGFDPDEVRALLLDIARAWDSAQHRALAAEHRVRELEAVVAQHDAAVRSAKEAGDDAEILRRTLVLAQRTADAAIAEANVEARSILSGAEDEALKRLHDADVRAAQLLADAESEVAQRRDGAAEVVAAELAQLEVTHVRLVADVAALERVLAEHRAAALTASSALLAAADDPSGLARVLTTNAPDALDGEPGEVEPGDVQAVEPSPVEPVQVQVVEPVAVEHVEGQAEEVTGEVPVVMAELEPVAEIEADAEAEAIFEVEPVAEPAPVPEPAPVAEAAPPVDDDFDVAELLAAMAEPTPPGGVSSRRREVNLFDDAEADADADADEHELVNSFFDAGPYADDRWKPRRDRA